MEHSTKWAAVALPGRIEEGNMTSTKQFRMKLSRLFENLGRFKAIDSQYCRKTTECKYLPSELTDY